MHEPAIDAAFRAIGALVILGIFGELAARSIRLAIIGAFLSSLPGGTAWQAADFVRKVGRAVARMTGRQPEGRPASRPREDRPAGGSTPSGYVPLMRR